MARPRVKPRTRMLLGPGVLAVVASVAWFLLPAPFSHGLILGLLIGPLALVGLVFLLARRVRRRLDARLDPPPLPTASWDYAMELVDLDGEPADLRGAAGSVLVLNFWATQCAPCVAEMPGLQRLRDATADLGVRFALVTREPRDVARRFAQARALDLPIYVLAGEPPACFESRAVPATFVLDRRGRIALRHVGAAAWDAEEVVAFVRDLATAPARMQVGR